MTYFGVTWSDTLKKLVGVAHYYSMMIVFFQSRQKNMNLTWPPLYQNPGSAPGLLVGALVGELREEPSWWPVPGPLHTAVAATSVVSRSEQMLTAVPFDNMCSASSSEDAGCCFWVHRNRLIRRGLAAVPQRGRRRGRSATRRCSSNKTQSTRFNMIGASVALK